MEEKLLKEIQDQLDGLSHLDQKSDEFNEATKSVCSLMDRMIDIRKFESECAIKESELDNKSRELDLKEQSLSNEKKRHIIDTALKTAGFAATTTLTIWGTIKTFQFEETGSITSNVGRKFIDKLIKR